ncbi:MAG: hypothetical protein ABI603_04250 [Acidobacteriota bacterium]
MTPQEREAGIKGLEEQATAAARELDEVPRSPFEHRRAAETARALRARYVSCWAANQKLENAEQQLTDPEMFIAALRRVQVEIEAEHADAVERLERSRDETERRTLTRQVDLLAAESVVIRRGPEQVSPSFAGIPDDLVRRLATIGVGPAPGSAHVFEGRGGMQQLQAVIEDLRRERSDAMAILVRELEPVAAG